MKRHSHLWEKIISPDNLALALAKARKGKNTNKSVRIVVADSDRYLSELHDILADGKFHTAEYYHKLIFEPKLRLIYALPFFPDRIVHHAIMNILEPIWDNLMYYHSYSCRKGKGQHKASYLCRKYVQQYRYVAQLDISQFYVNIDHGLLKECYRRKIKDRQLLTVLDDIVDSVDVRSNNIKTYRMLVDKGISIEQTQTGLQKLLTAAEMNDNRPSGAAVGNLISQWFGNLFLTDIDFSIHIPHIRFCDDILMFSNDKHELKENVNLCTELLAGKRLMLSKSRLFPTMQGVDFCGYKTFPNGVTLLRKSTAKRKKREMKNLHKADANYIRGALAAMNGLLKHANTYNLRRCLQEIYNETL